MNEQQHPNFSEVKLIVSDMDGTLLNSNNEMSSSFFKLFRKLKDQNIKFIAASGRQYHSIVDKFKSIEDEIIIIAENGGLAKEGNQELILCDLTSTEVQLAIESLRTIDGAFIVLCGENSAFIETNNEKFISKFEKYYTNYTIVNDLTKVNNERLLKIAVYHFESSELHIYPHIQELKENLKVVVSGSNWLDISHPKANKGYALKKIQQNLGISKEETMVFGDYNNDLEMLDCAYYSFAMENAHPDVKKTARFKTKSNDNNGVEFVLQQVIDQF